MDRGNTAPTGRLEQSLLFLMQLWSICAAACIQLHACFGSHSPCRLNACCSEQPSSDYCICRADGGNVQLVEIDGPVVYLKLQGACGSCPSSLTTMTMGIKRRLQEKIPVRARPLPSDCHSVFLPGHDQSAMKFITAIANSTVLRCALVGARKGTVDFQTP